MLTVPGKYVTGTHAGSVVVSEDGKGGQVIEIVQGPEGPQPGRSANLRDLRDKPLDIELDTGTANNTLRLMELQTLAAMQAQGLPVDPVLMIEKAVASSPQEVLAVFVRAWVGGRAEVVTNRGSWPAALDAYFA